MPRRLLFWSLAALAVCVAGWQAWSLRWSCDDAYISYRYAQHFVDGHGLVFNLDPKEHPVEGYSNFSWTMWLALGMALGCRGDAIETWAAVSGVLCHAGTVLLLAGLAWRASGKRAFTPIAACAHAAHHHAASLAPAGLETALFALLLTALAATAFALRCARQAWLGGFLGVLLAMTRPDGALVVAVVGAFVLFDAWRRREARLVLGYTLPFVLVFAPYLAWRFHYYGDLVPNTAHAKSAADPYVQQGFAYTWDYLRCYWPLLPAALLVPWFVLRRPDPLAALSPWLSRRPWLVLLLLLGSYTGFVVWVGGDFMFARFLLPVTPLWLFGYDLAALRWRRAWIAALLFVVATAGTWLRQEPAGLDDWTRPVSDNRAISVAPLDAQHLPGVSRIDAYRAAGHRLGELFAGLDVRIGLGGSHANLAYRSNATVAIECASGLTDRFIASVKVPVRSRVGHEKPFSLYPGYLERRSVHFMFDLNYGKDDWWRHVEFPCTPVPLPGRLVTWDPELMRELKRREPKLVCIDFEQFIDDYLARAATLPQEQVRQDHAKFVLVWPGLAVDERRQQAFAVLLR